MKRQVGRMCLGGKDGWGLFLPLPMGVFSIFCLSGCQPCLNEGGVETMKPPTPVQRRASQRPRSESEALWRQSLKTMEEILARYEEIASRDEFPAVMTTSDLSEGSQRVEHDFQKLRAEIEKLVSPTSSYLLRSQRIREKENPGTTTASMLAFQRQQELELSRVKDEVYEALQVLCAEGRLDVEAWQAVSRFVHDWQKRQRSCALRLGNSISGTARSLVVGAYLFGTTYDLTCLLLYFWEVAAPEMERG